MTIQHSGQLLVRIHRQHFNFLNAAGFTSGTLSDFQPKPLFQASHRAGLGFASASSDRPDWIVITPKPQPEKHPWDIAHEHVRGIAPNSAVFSSMGDVYMEPDLLQPVPGDISGVPATKGLDPNFPPTTADNFMPAWHLGKGFGNFQAAWAKGATGIGVRIAHLDTGYWPDHISTPRNIRPEQGYNFYENNYNVIDPGTGGLFMNPGHGTATLALLAGNRVSLKFNGKTYKGPIGGAPDAEVVPVRIGPSVIHLYTQPLAQGLDYACVPGEFPPCQVVSLSHGGLPSVAWAEATNRCYEAGVVVVAASGDSYFAIVMDIATHFTVYPSAFNRVITATGATFLKGPYITTVPLEVQGCWGPDSVMAKAAGGYTPNVPWMTWGTVDQWDMNGCGTSASTPQLAAACALWIGLYGDRFRVPWQRVSACREALLNTLAMKNANPSQIGRGILDAEAMLDPTMVRKIEAMIKNGKLAKVPEDEVSFPFWRLLFGLGPPRSALDQMYETEAAQILARSRNPRLIEPIRTDPTGKKTTHKNAKKWRDDFLAEPNLSNALRNRMNELLEQRKN